MKIHGSFVFGFDTDTPDIFEKTDEFVKTNEIDLPEAVILTPFPGTPLYKRYEEQDRILTRDWGKYDLKHVVFKPKNMTAEELFENTKQLYEGWYTNSIIFKRSIKDLKNGFRPFIGTVSTNYMLKAWM